MKRLIFFIGFMTLATFGLIQLVVTEPTREEDPGTDLPTRQTANVMSMTEVSMILHQGERISWRLWAQSAQLFQGDQGSRLDHVRFTVYAGKGEDDPQSILSGQASLAWITGTSGRITLERDVELRQGNRLNLHTQQLNYDSVTGELVAPGPVLVITPEGEHYGDAMRYEIGEERLTFARPRFAH